MLAVIAELKKGKVIIATHDLVGATARLCFKGKKGTTDIAYSTWEALYKRELLTTQSENGNTGTYILSDKGSAIETPKESPSLANTLNKRVFYYSLPLFGNQFKGMAFDMAQLSAKFQIWCQQFGLTDSESFALFTAGSADYHFLNNDKKLEALAHSVIGKLPKGGIVDLTPEEN